MCKDDREPQKCFWRPNTACAYSQTSRRTVASSSSPFDFVGVFHTRGLTCQYSPKLYFVGFLDNFCTHELTRADPHAHALQPQVSPFLYTETHSEAFRPSGSGTEIYSEYFMHFRRPFPTLEAKLNVNTLFSHYKIVARTQYANKYRLRSNTGGYGCKGHYTDSKDSDTTVPSETQLYFLPFSVLAVRSETFGYDFVSVSEDIS